MFRVQNHLPKIILAVIIVFAFFLMLGPAKQDSAIMDELAHIPAGYSYVKYFDYRLNPEHPPLVKALSAIPLLFQNLNFPINKETWQNEVNGQWSVGTQFLYEEGNNADKIILYSRLFPILLTLLLIGFTYFWASKLIGRWWSLLPTTLIAFSPNFLAHGHYVTTDIGASLGFMIGLYFFLKSIYKPNKKNTIVAGLALGIAELLKFSTTLLIPLFLLITLIVFIEKSIKELSSPILGKSKKIFKYFFNDFGKLFLIFLIALIVIYLVYFIFTFNYPIEKQFSDTTSILQSFGKRWLADPVIAMSHNNILRPLAHYFLGVLMVMQRSSGGNTIYFLNQVSASGSHYYFPIVFLMKETLPALIIIFIALISAISKIVKTIFSGTENIKTTTAEYLTAYFSEFSMLLIVIIYWTYSLSSTLNIGFRHIIPTLPFIYILATLNIKKLFYLTPQGFPTNIKEKLINLANKLANLGVKTAVLAVLIIWLLIGVINAYPFYLSKFNEFFGGTANGYQYITDSNFDWGQDLKKLRDWVNNPPIGPDGAQEVVDKIAIDYFGGGNPKYYFGDKAENWTSAEGTPLESGIKWLAVSVNTVQNSTAKTASGFTRDPQNEYLWLKNPLSPDYRAGTSIFIYKLSE